MGTTTSTTKTDSPVKIVAQPKSALGTASSFTTQFGTMVEGMYITWSNTISQKTGDTSTAVM